MTKQQGIPLTYVASAINAGGTSTPAKNIAGFTASWAAQFGQTGEAISEIMLISGSPAGTVLNLGTSPSHPAGTLLFGHAQDTPIYQIHYDQIVFYRSTTGTAGPFAALATVNIQSDNLYTQYDDTTGAASYAYYAQYYNSVTTDLSGSSSIFIPGGPTFYSLQAIRQRTKDKLFSAGYIRNDSVVTDWLNEFVEEMSNAAIKVNQGYMLGTAAYGFGTAGLGTITDSYFKMLVKCEVTYDNGVTYIPAKEIPAFEYSETDYFSINAPRYSWLGENVFEILPHQQAGSVKMTYASRFTPLVNDTDELPQHLKAYTTAATEYCLSVAYGLDQKDAESQQHFQQYMQGQTKFIAEITPRDLTGPKLIALGESISGLEDSTAEEYGDYVW